MFVEIIYSLFFIMAIFAALMVVISPHPVYSALYLVLTMISIAGLFVMMNAQLAAMFQVIVYAGAIMVLFLFVIMLLSIGRQEELPWRTRHVRWTGLAFVAAFILQLAIMLGGIDLNLNLSLEQARNIGIQPVAMLLMKDYIYAFEMTSVLLLIAVIGAIVLARRQLLPAEAHRDEGR